MMIRKAFKFRLYPNSEQQKKLATQFGCTRFVYNHYRRVREEYYQETKSGLTYRDCADDLVDRLKIEHAWLKESDSQVLQQALKDLDSAYQNFFAGRAGYPKFKKKHDKQSIRYPQRFKFGGNTIYLPKVGYVKVVRHRNVEGEMKNATVSRTKTGKYFVSIQCEVETDVRPKTNFLDVGIDLGIKDFAIMSSDFGKLTVEQPKHLRKAERTLKIRQRRLSRKVKGGNSRSKTKLSLACTHEKVANRRNDFHHKLSRSIVDRFGAIGIEDLNVAGMVKNHNLAKSISDAGWSQFVTFLTYKADWYGSEIVKHSRWFASSKTCSDCGYVYRELALAERSWICPDCGCIHDRDENAAKNLRPTTRGARESNAVGDMSSAVRRSAPEKFQVTSLEAQYL